MIEDKSLIEPLLQHDDLIVAESCAVALNNIKNRQAEEEELLALHKRNIAANEAQEA